MASITQSSWRTLSKDDLYFLCIILLFQVSILYSVFLLSLSMFGLGIFAVKPYFRDWNLFWQRTKRFLLLHFWWLIGLHFIIVLIGGYYSDDTSFWLSRLRLKTPFLLLPWAFYMMPSLSRKVYDWIYGMLVVVIATSTLPVVFSILADYGGVVETLSQGQSLALPGNHIRYSLLVSIACVSAFVLWYKRAGSSMLNKGFFLVAGYLFLFSHLIAVRSGLITLYAGVILFCVVYLLKGATWRWGWGVIFGVMLVPFLAYFTLPSLQAKVDYAVEDYQEFRKGKWSAYSDAERLLSIEGGAKLFRENPWLGIGYGDLRYEMRAHFRKAYNMPDHLLPHNQYLTILASGGVLAFLLFCLAIGFPIYQCYRDFYFQLVNLVLLLSMLVENTLESSIGIAMYIMYIGIALHFSLTPAESVELEPDAVRQR